jgi:type II secretory pathway pseudopilin PulG
MMNMHKQADRGMTIIELLISFGVLLLVLSLSTVLFQQAFTHSTLTEENMTNEQLTRVAMARVNSSLSQASVDANSLDALGGTPSPAVLIPVPNGTSAPAIVFYRVKTLDPAAIPTGVTNAPNPGYDVHIISYDPVAQTLNEYTMDYQTVYKTLQPSPAPVVLATNVLNFGVMQVNGNTNEYQITITVNNILNPTKAEKPFTLNDDVTIMN